MLCQTSRDSQSQFRQAGQIIEEFLEPKGHIFWVDFLLSSLVGWSCFIIAGITQLFSWQMLSSAILAVFALYRALVFVHEFAHTKSKTLPGLETVWNLLAGIPLLVPSFLYVGIHADHHKLANYSTDKDPEYLPFAGKKAIILGIIAFSSVIPGLLLIRFLILAPVGLLIPAFHRLLERHASAFCLNPAYCRKVTDKERSIIIQQELAVFAIWSIFIVSMFQHWLSWQWLVLWYVVTAAIVEINLLRTLGAHRYRHEGESIDRESQILDSIDTPGKFWTVLWAPVGLRYHALHHYFPNIPYHNLALAHQHLIAALPKDSSYCCTSSPSLWQSLKTLWNNG